MRNSIPPKIYFSALGIKGSLSTEEEEREISCAATRSTSMMVPCGYRFRPRDEELLVYLKRKIHRLPLPCDIIKEVELYKYDPSDLLGQFVSKGEEKCYFFTPTYRKYAKGSRPNRATNNGYWKASTADIQIKDEEDNDIGTKRTLVFYSGEHPHGRKTNWIMHEYKLMEYLNTSTNVQTPIDPMKLDEWVLCSIYENLNGDKREKMKRKASEELDTRTEKRAFVVQEPQSQINEHKANDQCVVSSYDIHKKEPIHDASDMGWDIGLMSDSDFAKLMEMTATEEVGTKREERTVVVQQEQPQIEYGDNDQSVVVFSADYLEDIINWDVPPISDSYYADLAELTEVMTGEELDTRSEINVVQDNDQSVFFSYDDLQKLPILDASDMEGWDDIPPIPMSDSDFDDFEEFMEMMPGEELDRRSEITNGRVLRED
ncbi:NAC transcription factor 25-like protein [Cinnamomum micranthum f. kanehirae]|uniref:NAC transcription factor 25-like protein n=1 Tax=Cinnamomum micranthum f. kanehirae TaxID=337451 RepID=A0A3S4PHH7_9MAGN|nr:NAC transcription factor 25-like protein [Cinnamomum micranthum f. kanehirae]